jgi:hypothetical protein
MAFIKLFPPEGGKALAVPDIIRRLRDKFAIVDTDPEKGRSYVAKMIAATERFSDAVPHKQKQLKRLRSIQNAAVYVRFGDAREVMASCCLVPDSDLFFSNPDQMHGPGRPLVERCAAALGYQLSEG